MMDISPLTPGRWLLRNWDTTVAQPLVSELFRLFPDSDGYAVRRRIMESDVEISGDPKDLFQAATSLAARIRGYPLPEFCGLTGRLRHPLSFSEANMLRRALMTRVEVFAFDKVHVRVNTSKTTLDEQVAHRLGQLALCGSVAATARIQVRDRDALASDVLVEGQCPVAREDWKTIIAHLGSGEELDASAEAIQGSVLGSNHCKFSAVSSVAVEPGEVFFTITYESLGQKAPEACWLEALSALLRELGWFQEVFQSKA